jgi:hypothetical protein
MDSGFAAVPRPGLTTGRVRRSLGETQRATGAWPWCFNFLVCVTPTIGSHALATSPTLRYACGGKKKAVPP